MRALVYLGPGRMELRQAPDPEPAAGEVVVASRASAICGSDLHGFREASPRRIPPLVMGHETAGVIDATGEGVDASLLGRRVVLKPIVSCGACDECREGDINRCVTGRLVGRDLPGGFAERFVVPAAAVVPIPPDVPDDVATLTEPLANAMHVASRGVRHGDRVFVIGAGPIGVLMARAALLFGAEDVHITDPVAERLVLARAQGAIPLTGDDPAAAIRAATGGRGPDLVIDAAGFEATWALGLEAVRTGGRIHQVGLGSGAGRLDYFAVLGKEVSIAGSYAWTDDDFARALELVSAGELDATGWITRMPLAEGQRGFEELVNGHAGRFKVVLEMGIPVRAASR